VYDLTNRVFTITERLLKSRITRNAKESCHTCKIKIKAGDSVVTPISGSGRSRLIRHEACAKRVNLID